MKKDLAAIFLVIILGVSFTIICYDRCCPLICDQPSITTTTTTTPPHTTTTTPPHTTTTTPPQDVQFDRIKRFFPHFIFSSGEKYYPCCFYFDGDDNVENNEEQYTLYKDRNGENPPYFAYVHEVTDDTHLTIQYWLYYVYNTHPIAMDHKHDWDSAVFIIFNKDEILSAESLNDVQPVQIGFKAHLWIDYYQYNECDWFGEDPTHVQTIIAKGSHGAYPNLNQFVISDEFYHDPHEPPLTLTYEDFNWIVVEEPTWTAPKTTTPPYDVSIVGNRPGDDCINHPNFEGKWMNRFKGADPGPWQRLSEDHPMYKEDLYSSLRKPNWDVVQPKGDGLGSTIAHNILSIFKKSPDDLHVYDSAGRHVGWNETYNKVDTDIPFSIYYKTLDGEQVLINNPVLDTYTVVLEASESGEHSLFVLYSDGVTMKSESETIVMEKGDREVYNVQLKPGDVTLVPLPNLFATDLQIVDITGMTITVEYFLRLEGELGPQFPTMAILIDKAGYPTNVAMSWTLGPAHLLGLLAGETVHDVESFERPDWGDGEYFITVYVDYSGAISESNENDNWWTTSFGVGPNLIVMDLQVVNVTGKTIIVNYTLRLEGELSPPPPTMGILITKKGYLTNVAKTWTLSDTRFLALLSGETVHEDVSFERPDWGNGEYSITIVADYNEAISESNEDDNRRKTSINVT